MKASNHNKCKVRNLAEKVKSLNCIKYEVPDQKGADMLFKYNLHHFSCFVLYHTLTDLSLEFKIIMEFQRDTCISKGGKKSFVFMEDTGTQNSAHYKQNLRSILPSPCSCQFRASSFGSKRKHTKNMGFR